MPLSSRLKNKLMDEINMSFANIGNEKPTTPPRISENTAPIAWDYFVSSHLLALARKRKDIAQANAVRAGVIFDHIYHPRKPEDSGPIYLGDHVMIYLTVKNPGARVDVDKMCAILAGYGVPQDKIDTARETATVESKPAHEFKATLVTGSAIPNGK